MHMSTTRTQLQEGSGAMVLHTGLCHLVRELLDAKEWELEHMNDTAGSGSTDRV